MTAQFPAPIHPAAHKRWPTSANTAFERGVCPPGPWNTINKKVINSLNQRVCVRTAVCQAAFSETSDINKTARPRASCWQQALQLHHCTQLSLSPATPQSSDRGELHVTLTRTAGHLTKAPGTAAGGSEHWRSCRSESSFPGFLLSLPRRAVGNKQLDGGTDGANFFPPYLRICPSEDFFHESFNISEREITNTAADGSGYK